MSAIGVFDSGIGGLSILKCLRAALPLESFVYYADNAHHPYGEKSSAQIIARSLAVAQTLIAKYQIKALVIACNTATAAAIDMLRLHHPHLPIVGIEPALKPAAAVTRTKRIAVLATRSTLVSNKFLALKQTLSKQATFVCIPCTGLADLIEQLSAGSSSEQDIQQTCKSFLKQVGSFDTLVLGCTHYSLIKPIFRALVGSKVTIVDNGDAVARRLATLVRGDLPVTLGQPTLQLTGSGNTNISLTAANRWL